MYIDFSILHDYYDDSMLINCFRVKCYLPNTRHLPIRVRGGTAGWFCGTWFVLRGQAVGGNVHEPCSNIPQLSKLPWDIAEPVDGRFSRETLHPCMPRQISLPPPPLSSPRQLIMSIALVHSTSIAPPAHIILMAACAYITSITAPLHLLAPPPQPHPRAIAPCPLVARCLTSWHHLPLLHQPTTHANEWPWQADSLTSSLEVYCIQHGICAFEVDIRIQNEIFRLEMDIESQMRCLPYKWTSNSTIYIWLRIGHPLYEYVYILVQRVPFLRLKFQQQQQQQHGSLSGTHL